MQVSAWMTPNPVAVRALSTVREARRLLGYHRVRALPVVDGGRVVGMLTDADVRIDDAPLTGAAGTMPSRVNGLLGSGQTVASVLTGPAVTVRTDDDVAVAAELLLVHRVGTLAVVDRARHLVGVITVGDCLRALLTRTTVPA